MDEAKFAAMAVTRLAAAVRTAEQHGWKRSPTDDSALRKQGVSGRMVRVAHPDAPFPVILYRGSPGTVMCALHHDERHPYVWVGVTRDEAIVAQVIDDAPVVADLVARLGVELPPVAAVSSGRASARAAGPAAHGRVEQA